MSYFGLFGLSYTARHLVPLIRGQGFSFCWTSRLPDKVSCDSQPLNGILWGNVLPSDAITHILLSAPPDKMGQDPFLYQYGKDSFPALQWIGYLSTTGVYGDCGGEWVCENKQPHPVSDVSIARLKAEQSIQAWAIQKQVPCAIFRLSGIYGEGRNILESISKDTARHIVKNGQVFNRIHVQDIARFISHVSEHTLSGIWNVSDDLPEANSTILQYACHLLNCAVPEPVLYDDIAQTLSPAMRRFYSENKRINNRKMKETLGSGLLYPTYKQGLDDLYIINQSGFSQKTSG